MNGSTRTAGPRIRTRCVAMVLGGLLSLGIGSAHAHAIVVGHDVNTLGSAVAGAQEATFAVNVARFLTADSAVKAVLLFESNPGDGTRNFAPVVLDALRAAGVQATVTSNYATDFTGYGAIFVAQDYPTPGFLNNAALIDYVDAGGSVYLAGGVGSSPVAEAGGWSAFMGHYGLAFASQYNGLSAVPVDSTHPIFSGVTALRSGNGQSILDLGTDPDAHIVQTASGQNVYAVVSLPVPEPASAWMLLAGLGVMGTRSHRRWRLSRRAAAAGFGRT